MKKIFIFLTIILFLSPICFAEESTLKTTQAQGGDLIIVNGSGGGESPLNTFLIIDVEGKKAYTYNAYGNGGSKWAYQDLMELDERIDKERDKRCGKNRKRDDSKETEEGNN